MRILVIGGVAGGASAAARARRIDATAEIIMFEKGPNVSFSNCCLPYYLSGTVENSDALVLMTPERFKKQYDIEARVNSEVISIERAEKAITVRNTLSGEIYTEHYDKLVLAPGALPRVPRSIKGADGKNVFTVRNVGDVVAIKQFLDDRGVKDVAVIGGGFIGIEVCENLKTAGYNVSIIEAMEQILPQFDYDMVQTLHKELMDNGVALELGSIVTEITETCVKFSQRSEEKSVTAQAVIMAAGVVPDTQLAVKSGLVIGETGGIKVDHNYRTSDPDIYAVGDAIELFNRLAGKPGRLTLAWHAQMAARAAADDMYGIANNNRGYIGASCIRVFGLNAASVGLNMNAAKRAGITYDYAYVLPNDRVSLMPDSNYLCLKLLFEVPTGRVLGAQAIGKGEADRRIDVISTLIHMNGTLEDLKDLELCYSPVYSTAKDAVNMAALVGLNILYGRCKQVHMDRIRELVETGAYIVDVREEGEFAAGHLKGAHNIPLSQLRDRLDEIPRDVPVYLHCRSSHRSYNAVMCLQGHGYSNVYNIAGSYLGFCLYEYCDDVRLNREPIFTAYNFN